MTGLRRITDSSIEEGGEVDLQFSSSLNTHYRFGVDILADVPIHIHATMRDRLPREGNETIVDVGCNDARWLVDFYDRGHQGPLIGLDKSYHALLAGHFMWARQKLNGGYLAEADVDDPLELENDSVDIVVFDHILNFLKDPKLALEEARRVIRNGGYILATAAGRDNKFRTHEIKQRGLIAVGATTVEIVRTHDYPAEKLREDAEDMAGKENVLHTPFQSDLTIRDPAFNEADATKLAGWIAGYNSYRTDHRILDPVSGDEVTIGPKPWEKTVMAVALEEVYDEIGTNGFFRDYIDRSGLIVKVRK